ncbi:IMV membrane protein [Eptesipox virus]|uniref:IMV membrane protein n=1 Tax=Eptesipox virus TaxID=1329402 RepID=A0A220T6I3_9POXV|nr:IMV membrane protein [Eptesipox virus]ASK51315.1 IMV membrane protein [Eptesipox virus]WAH71073.1 IMV membrane protein [Eptesipox virus]
MSYLSYYNMLDDFSAGAGVLDKDLFTKEEENAFLPKVDNNGGSFNPFNNNIFSEIFLYNDVKTLIGLILFVLAITTPPIIAIIMIIGASTLLPFPSLVIAYCLSTQILNVNANKSIGMAIFCVVMAIISIIVSITMSTVAYTISYIILAILFCVYIFNLAKLSMPYSSLSSSTIRCTKDFRAGDKYMKNPSFMED